MRATETNRRRSALLGAGMVMAAGIMAQSATAAENMRFHGTLVAEPCVIQPGDEDIPLDFGTIVDKYLYLNTRSHSQTFALHLTECDQPGQYGGYHVYRHRKRQTARPVGIGCRQPGVGDRHRAGRQQRQGAAAQSRQR